MSVFDNHLDQNTMDRDADKMILVNFKISNSGSTLIPKTGLKTKIPARTFKEEHSIFRSMYGKPMENEAELIYPVFEGILHGMDLPCLVYNRKRYYQVNREVKRQIAYQVYKEIQIK